ncbi:MAG: hypothetical protein JWQ21_227 [Herminiimonas sp.]|nr:hypothetical protein [Herminiimonas sp.]
MRPYRAFAAKTAIFLVAALLLGCSAARLGYSNGETLSYWWLDSYVDFDADQKPWVRKEISDLFAWHRKTQLKSYVQLLTRTQKRIQGKVAEAELLADYDDLRKRVLVLADRALPNLADLALSLQPPQIANIEKKFASNNNTYRKDYLRGDIEQRQRFRFKKALKQAEYWFGNFSDEQERIIRAASDARPLNNELVMADRLQRQAALIALLKKIQAEKPGRDAVMAMLKDYIETTVNRSLNAEHKAFFDASANSSAHMMAVIVNGTTPAQKEHFVKTLQQWIDDFNVLSM